MTEEVVSWSQRLNHIRFSALLVLMEKSILILALALLFLVKLPAWLVVSVSLVGFIFVLHAHVNHFAIVEAAGMPTVRLRI